VIPTEIAMFYINKSEGYVARIAKEMINIETGCRMYDENGKWIEGRKANYPILTNPKGTSLIRIKSSYGILYLPVTKNNYHVMANNIVKAIETEMRKHSEILTALQGYHAIDTGAHGFTNLKTKNNIKGSLVDDDADCAYCSNKYPNLLRYLVFTHSRGYIQSRLRDCAKHGKFIWLIVPSEAIHEFIFSLPSGRDQVDIITSVMYDPDKILCLHDGSTWNNSLSLNELSKFGTISHVTIYGVVSKANFDMLTESEWHSEIIAEAKRHENIHTTLSKHPGYVEGWTTTHQYYHSDNVLNYSNNVKFAFEIIRWLCPKKSVLGFHSGYLLSYMRNWRSKDPLYEVDLKDIILSNPDKCNLCETPLYDDIYCLFPDKKSNACTAYCPICLHANFNLSGGDNQPRVSSHNASKYYVQDNISHKDGIMARTKHPRTVFEVIDMIPQRAPFLDMTEYIEILKAAYREKGTLISRKDGRVETFMMMGADHAKEIDKIYVFVDSIPYSLLFDKKLFGSKIKDVTDDILNKIVFVHANLRSAVDIDK
jgi:hypothetical protein